MMIRSRARVVLFCLCTLVTLGCGGGPNDAPDLAPVTGTVTLDGNPVADANVTFIAESGPTAIGKTDSSGKFVLGTKSNNDGATIGNHKVTVTKSAGMPESNDPTALETIDEEEQTIPAKYADMNSSGLSATIEAGKDNVVTLELTSQ